MFRRVITSTRRARFNNVAKVPKRNMGGGEAPVPTEGVEGAIRKVYIHIYVCVCASLCVYVYMFTQ